MVSGSGGYHLLAVNNAVVANDGEAFRIYDYRADLLHNTIVSNTGAAVEGSFTATLALTNDLIAFNTGAGVITHAGSTALASYNLFWHNGSDGYHLSTGSVAINRGAPTWVTTDIDENPRPVGPLPDIGADEWIKMIYLPLVLRN
jgi:hypothetical protein